MHAGYKCWHLIFQEVLGVSNEVSTDTETLLALAFSGCLSVQLMERTPSWINISGPVDFLHCKSYYR